MTEDRTPDRPDLYDRQEAVYRHPLVLQEAARLRLVTDRRTDQISPQWVHDLANLPDYGTLHMTRWQKFWFRRRRRREQRLR